MREIQRSEHRHRHQVRRRRPTPASLVAVAATVTTTSALMPSTMDPLWCPRTLISALNVAEALPACSVAEVAVESATTTSV